jgi:Zn-dependent metalloprotease
MFKKSRFHELMTIVVMVTVFFSTIQPTIASTAQDGDDDERQANAQMGRDGIKRQVNPQDPGRALVNRFASEFGIKNRGGELSEMRSNRSGDERVTVRYQQKYQDIPVMGGELIVNTNENGDMNSEVSPNLAFQIPSSIVSDVS